MKKLLLLFSLILFGLVQAGYAQSILCPGNNVILTLTGYTGTIQWESSTNGTSWSPMSGATSATMTDQPGQETWYRAGVTDGTCPVVYSDTTHITISGLWADAGSDTTVCLGSTIGLGGSPAAGGGNPGYSYSWSPATGLSATNVPNPTCTPTGPTAYILTVTDGTGCTAMDTVQIDTGGTASTGTQTFTYTGSNVTFVVPPCVYTITAEAWGAEGGNGNGTIAGKGAYIKGDLAVTPGETLRVTVGQKGDNGTCSLCGGGGGGGSFVVRISGNSPLLIAGGGGGGCYNGSGTVGSPGSATINSVGGYYPPSVPGNGGYSDNCCGGGTGGGGGGWNTAGTGNNWSGGGGVAGGAGGTSNHTTGWGGFGGGAGSYHGGGGGGGYTGGPGGTVAGGGGGAGSYNSGTNQTNTAGNRSGNGQVKLTW